MEQEKKGHKINQLLILYAQGRSLSVEDKKCMIDWIAVSDANKADFDKLKKTWEASAAIKDFEAIDVDAQWIKFKSKTSLEVLKEKQLKRIKLSFFKIAASIIFVIGLGFYFNSILNNEVKLVGEMGTANRFVLPDNTIVWLNENSVLRYDKDFGKKDRDAYLEGEGYFEVVHNSQKPFIVFANNTKTKVLGTTFNLNSNSKTGETQLVLVEGSVQFQYKEKIAILKPNDKVKVTANGELQKQVNHSLNFDSWKTKILKFENTTINQAMQEIGLLYNKNISIQDSKFAACTLTGVFNNESFEEIIETLHIILNIEYSLQGKKMIISGGDCQK